ncbi:site-specific DNA-methyltransferase [Nitrobacter sp. Nb-311A]|uniref:site-specific DNA-methyltransferase n=1 Tax=Nitrobacter sp. Nb-311A TaxID=314253 RepID=UPI000323932F|nr:DNA methyltransferase [Nitrobacter sp. Nb-311A]
MLNLSMVPVEALTPNPRNAKTHPRKQIRALADVMANLGFWCPILADKKGKILAGEGRWQAANLLGLKQVPVIRVDGLSEAKLRALALADNKIAESAGWDREKLCEELVELSHLLVEEGLDVSITGFVPPEIDQLLADFEEDLSDPADDLDHLWSNAEAVTKPGDLWKLQHHRLLCGDARDENQLVRLMNGSTAAMAFLDPPYNVRIRDVVGRGRSKHSEFKMGVGELSDAEFVKFLRDSLGAVAAVSCDGAIHYVCMDWRHIGQLFEAGGSVYGASLNLAVWVKTNAGQGSFYRSQHELIGIFRVGRSQHLNNVELGRHGRSRSNVWKYAGVNTFRAGRLDDLKSHPTVKPVALVADAIKDATRRRDIVLDTFCGSGTSILAAERVGRRAYALELEPRFVDLAIRRWQEFTGRDAIHLDSGLTFHEMSERHSTLSDLPEKGADHD